MRAGKETAEQRWAAVYARAPPSLYPDPPIVQCSGQQSEPSQFFFSLDVSGPPPNSETDDNVCINKSAIAAVMFNAETNQGS